METTLTINVHLSALELRLLQSIISNADLDKCFEDFTNEEDATGRKLCSSLKLL